MCGIVGICRYHGSGREEIQAMMSRIIRRGPDSGSYWLDGQERVALGHRRLAVVDLSENGAQPMISPSGRYVIVFNGEIYNCPSIRRRMEQGADLRLKGTSDTEVILNAFERYGVDQTLALMKGMFAIALWDREEKTLYLMRDRVGEKPLYYGYVDDRFVFASDIAAIEAVEGFHNALDEEVLPLYFQYGYIPAPYTIYRDIYKLPAGTCLKVSGDFRAGRPVPYWSMAETARKGQEHRFCGSRREAADELERLLREAVRGQMIADVPLGAFLSGGIDSALVVSIMQSLHKGRVRTFTIGFEENGYNEAEYAKEIAAHLGTEHTELYVGEREALEMAECLAEAYSEPFADSSQIPTLLVSRLARQQVTVSLSGDGGDELFCGYNTYRVARQELQALQKRLAFLPGPARRGAGAVCRKFGGLHTGLLYKAGSYLAMDTVEEAHRRMGLEDVRHGCLSKVRTRPADSNAAYPDGFLEEAEHNLMLMDLLQYHPDDILVKVDRAGMFFSLESRIPLLDKDVVEFAWSLPLSYQLNGGVTKQVMRDVLYRHVPQEMMERPKKGFSMPIRKWLLSGRLKAWAEEILDAGRKGCGAVLDTGLIDSLWKEYQQGGAWSDQIWYILVLEQWLLSRGLGGR